MPQARDEAGHIWETDASGNVLRLIQPAGALAATAPTAAPGPQPLFTVPQRAPDPLDLARNSREQRSSDLSAQEAQLRIKKAQDEQNANAPPLPDMNAPTGNDFLKTLSAARASQVRALAEGRMALPTGAAMRSPTGAALLADVAQYDPTFDVVNAPARIAARKAFTSGTQGKNVQSFNTAIGHLGSLAKAAEALDNGSFPMWNGVANAFETATGDPRVTNFDTAKQAVVEELERAFKGAAGTVHASAEWERTINSARSPAQLRGAIKQAAELLQSRIDATRDSYNAAMGTADQPLPMLNQHAADALGSFQSEDYLSHGYSAAHGLEGSGPPSDTPPGAPPATPPRGTPPGTPPAAPDAGGGNAMVGWNDAGRKVRDPQASALIDQMIRSGATADEINAKLTPMGLQPVDQAAVSTAQAYLKTPSGRAYKGSLGDATRYEDTTLGQNIAGSAVGAGTIALANQGLFGTLPKIVAGTEALTGRLGGDNRAIGDIYNDALGVTNAKVEGVRNASPLNQAFSLAGDVGGYLLGERAIAGTAGAALKRIGGTLTVSKGAQAALNAAKPAALDAGVGGLTGLGSSDSLSEIPGNVGSGAALAAGGGVLGRGLARGAGALLSPIAKPAIRRLTDAGITLTPGQIAGASGGIVGRAVKGIEDRIAGFPVVGDVINSTRRGGVEDFNRAGINDALAPIGAKLPDDVPVGHAAIQHAQKEVSDAYTRALAPLQVTADAQYHSDIQSIVQRVGNMSKEQRDAYNTVLKNDVHPFLPKPGQGALTGENLQAIKKGLDKRIAKYTSQSASPADEQVGEQLVAVRDAYLNLAGRSDPAAAAEFAKANAAYSLLSRVEGAAAKSKDGVFTPNQFRQAVAKRGYGTTTASVAAGTSRMQQLATDASTILPNTVPDAGTAGRAALGLVGKSLGSGAPGALAGGTAGYQQNGIGGALGGAAVGGLLLSRPGSRAVQAIVAGSRGAKMNTLGALIRANPEILGTPAGSLLLTHNRE